MSDGQHYRVTGLGEDGDGIVDLAGGVGRPEYIPGALPGDLAHRAAGGGWDIEQRAGSGRRPAPLCPHFPACGGCTVQHMGDELYARWKGAKLLDALRRHDVVELGINDGGVGPMIRAPLASRRRAVLTAVQVAGQLRLGFHGHRSHEVVPVEACAVLRPAIVMALPALRGIATLLGGKAECRLTVLDTGRGLDVSAETGKPRRYDKHLAAITQLAVSGRILRLTVDGEPVLMRAAPMMEVAGVAVVPPPAAFVQASAEAEAAMTAIAVEAIEKARAKRVADLFCGLGAFALAVARKARVLAVDSDRPMIEALAAGARNASGLKPIETKVRDLFRDPLSPRELDHIDAVILDPPRAGAKDQAEALARSKVRTVVAVSCNPATLARDLRILLDGGYRLERAVPVDQFLFSAHLEAVAVLRR
ncbi:MAG: class I SAM-dependent RNA methyltransferase [Hyphomicrobiaceae bacterium]